MQCEAAASRLIVVSSLIVLFLWLGLPVGPPPVNCSSLLILFATVRFLFALFPKRDNHHFDFFHVLHVLDVI